MWGTIDGEPFFFMVAHWPSRLGGKDASEFKRIAVGEQMRRIADSVLKVNPATKIVAMGDFNDDPTDQSMARRHWVPKRKHRRSSSRAISTIPSTTCCVPVWERWPTATPGTSSTIS